jgi:hypothetical protein
MAGMPLRAKRGFREWFGLFLVFLTLLVIPGWVRGVINMVRETHCAWVFIPVMIGIGYGWNPDAHKIKW